MRIFALLLLFGFVEVNLSTSPLGAGSDPELGSNVDDKVGRCWNKLTGEEYREAERWNEGPCVSCICEKAGPVCASIACAMPLCKEGYKVATVTGHCCPTCVPSCTDESGREYGEGDSWSPHPCTTCTCYLSEQGRKQEACAVVDCPNPESCETKPIQIPGQCCPVCEEPCMDRKTGKTYSIGEEWSPDPCSHCICIQQDDGTLREMCAATDCPMISNCNGRIERRDGECCPVCVDEPAIDCSAVKCAAPQCDNPVYSSERCCATCPTLPDECTLVDCMMLDPNCEPVYLPDQPCCPVCGKPECPDGTARVACVKDPCSAWTECPNYPLAECRADYCGECKAVYYHPNGDVIANCEGECPAPQIFKTCGKACTPTCLNPLPMCTKQCVERCECPHTAPILHKQTCIAEERCPNYPPTDCETVVEAAESTEVVSPDRVSGQRGGVGEDSTPACEPVNCLADPCSVSTCQNFPYAKCKADYCGGCNAVFYDDNGAIISSCEGECPATQEWRECGSACTPTCSNPTPICTDQCVQRCECPRDAPVLYKQTCVPANECPANTGSGGSSTGGGSSGSTGGGSSGSTDGGSSGGTGCGPKQPKEPQPPNIYPEPECDNPVNCFADPCTVTTCPNYPRAKCRSNYCGGCNAQFFDINGDLITDCQGKCTAPKEYRECGSACPQTCRTTTSTNCVAVCTPGCSCPRSAPVLYQGTCVTRDRCPGGSSSEGFDGAPESAANSDSDTILRDNSTSSLSVTLTLLLLQAAVLFIFTIP